MLLPPVKSILKKLIIVQQARDEDIEKIKKKYQNLKVEHKIEKFFYNICLVSFVGIGLISSLIE